MGGAFKRGDLIASALGFFCTATGLSWALEYVPLWVPLVGLGSLFFYGVARGVYDDFEKAKEDRARLEKTLEERKKRKAINDLVGNALEEGLSLKQGGKYAFKSENQNLEDIEISGEHQARYDEEVRTWVDRTYNLTNEAFGKAEAQRFISNEGYTDEELFGCGLPPFVYLSSTKRKYLLPARLKRLDKLIDRANSLEINPDFDSKSIAQEAGESAAAARLRLATATEQSTAEIEQVAAQRNEFRKESEQTKAERDNQLRARCFYLSERLKQIFGQLETGRSPKPGSDAPIQRTLRWRGCGRNQRRRGGWRV